MATARTIRLRETDAPDDAPGQKRQVQVLVLALDDEPGLARALKAKARVWDVVASSRKEATARLDLALRAAPNKKKDRAGFLAWEEAVESVTQVKGAPAAPAQNEEVIGG